MAKTFIGELILRLKDDMSGKAAKAVRETASAMDKLAAVARRADGIGINPKFAAELQKLGGTAGQIDAVAKAYGRLNMELKEKGFAPGETKKRLAEFEQLTKGHFAVMADAARQAEKQMGGLHERMKNLGSEIRSQAQFWAVGGLVYGGVDAVRGGVIANAEMYREKFRQDTSRIPKPDQDRMLSEADRLTTLYPSAGLVQVLEMARAARTTMGDTDRALAILPDLVKGLVAMQSAGSDPNKAIGSIWSMLRGIDNAGQNDAGQIGIDQVKEIIGGLIRATQIEGGSDFDIGKLFGFARRGKIAVPGLSTDFLATVAPALMSDMTAEGFGTALSSAYQAFVIGSNAVASKANVLEQRRLGIRGDKGLVDANLFGTNPYEWVNKVLVPALQNDGVNLKDDTEVAQSIAKLSRNTNATGLLTRMVQQRAQIDKLVEQYGQAMGPEAADEARFKDPFTAAKGFVESLREVATAVAGMPQAVGILNGMSDGLQRFATALREQDPMAQLGLAGGVAAGAFGTWKIAAAIWGLGTAGTNLNVAATALQVAAASLSGNGMVDGLPGDGKPGAKGTTGFAAWARGIGRFLPVASLAFLKGSDEHNAYNNLDAEGREKARREARAAYDSRNGLSNHATDAMNYRQMMERVTTVASKNTPGIGRLFDDITAQAEQAGRQIEAGLSVQGNPTVNLSQLQAALNLVNQIRAGLAGIGPAINAANSQVSRQLNRGLADHGVTP